MACNCEIIGVLDSLDWRRKHKKWERTPVDLEAEIKKSNRGGSGRADFPEFKSVHLHVTSVWQRYWSRFSLSIYLFGFGIIYAPTLLPVTSVWVSISRPPIWLIGPLFLLFFVFHTVPAIHPITRCSLRQYFRWRGHYHLFIQNIQIKRRVKTGGRGIVSLLPNPHN